MSLPHKFRLASCSMVALIMIPAPGLINTFSLDTPKLSFDIPNPPVSSSIKPGSVAPNSQPAKKLSLLKRATNFGVASWYGEVLNGHKTASGETFDMNEMTAAHRTLPFGTMVRVVDVHSGRSVIVRINDRGVLFPDRIIDLSRGAAEKLGIRKSGVTNVHLEILNKRQFAAQQVATAQYPDPADSFLGRRR